MAPLAAACKGSSPCRLGVVPPGRHHPRRRTAEVALPRDGARLWKHPVEDPPESQEDKQGDERRPPALHQEAADNQIGGQAEYHRNMAERDLRIAPGTSASVAACCGALGDVAPPFMQRGIQEWVGDSCSGVTQFRSA